MNEHEIEELLDNWLADWELAREDGCELSVQELCAPHPELMGQLRERIDRLRSTSWMLVDHASNFLTEDAQRGQSGTTTSAAADLTAAELVSSLAARGLLTHEELVAMKRIADEEFGSAQALAAKLVEQGLVTKYQADVILFRRADPLLLDRYIILDMIGSGGMGVVFKALHRAMERIVAIKVLPPLALNSTDLVSRFQREVKSVAKLSHPHVVTAFDAHEHNGTHFLVMEYVDGEDLREVVERHGTMPVEEAISIIDQVAAGLGAAHELGMVHRDVKPTNIMLLDNGTAKLLDLGLARMMSLAESPFDPEITKDGLGMGTASYMSPEQASDAKLADARSDIYSLGCTLYFLLTGKAPFVRNSKVQTIIAHRQAPAPLLKELREDVTPRVEAIYQRMLAKSPNDRYQSVNELREDLAVAKSQNVVADLHEPKPALETRFTAANLLGTGGADPGYRIGSKTESPWKARTRRFDRLSVALLLLVVVLGCVGWGWSKLGMQRNAALHRDVAKWAIAKGGFVEIKTDLGQHEVESTSDLPESDFQIVGLDLEADSDDFSIEPALKLPTLESLVLTDFSQTPVKRISSLQTLKTLEFYGCAVTDSDLKELLNLKDLTTLVLRDCAITDKGMITIAQMQQLNELDIGGTGITSEGMQRLGLLNQLQAIDLSDLEISADDLRALPANIDELVMPFCDVDDEAVEVMRRFENLDHLDLQGNRVTETGIASLATLPKLTSLDLSDMNVTVKGLQALRTLPQLKALTLMGVTLNNKKYLALNELDNLEELDLSSSNLDDEGLMQLTSMENLEVLYLDDTSATEAGIARFQRTRGNLESSVPPVQ